MHCNKMPHRCKADLNASTRAKTKSIRLMDRSCVNANPTPFALSVALAKSKGERRFMYKFQI